MTDWPDDAAVERALEAALEVIQRDGRVIIDKMVRAVLVAAGPPPSAWRSIESAPREERWQLLWNGFWRGVGSYREPYTDDPDEPLWVDETDAFIEPPPTHWQPLPAPPEDEQ